MNEPSPLQILADAGCPFCAGVAELNKLLRNGHVPDAPDAYAYFYVCHSCAAVGGWAKSEAGALRLWSLRQPHGDAPPIATRRHEFHERYAEVRNVLHTMWGADRDRPGYDKKSWQRLENAINTLARMEAKDAGIGDDEPLVEVPR